MIKAPMLAYYNPLSETLQLRTGILDHQYGLTVLLHSDRCTRIAEMRISPPNGRILVMWALNAKLLL